MEDHRRKTFRDQWTVRDSDRAGPGGICHSHRDGGGCTATITFTVIEPTGVTMEKASNVAHAHGVPSVGIMTNIYITPDTVSFENIDVIEDDCVATVTGYFVGTVLDGVHHLGHGAGTLVGVLGVVEGKGSEVDGQDTAHVENRPFATPFSAGTFDWPIPWKFSVGAGAQKQFTTVHQKFTINAKGDMTVSKAGATGSAALNSPDSSF